MQGQGYCSGQTGHGLTDILVEIHLHYWDKEMSTAGFDFMNILQFTAYGMVYFNLMLTCSGEHWVKFDKD